MGFPDFDIPDPLVAPERGKNLLRRGLKWLSNELIRNASESIVYVTQNGSRICTRATIGSKLLKIDDPIAGFRIQWTDCDFLVRACDLRINGATIEPTRGDQVILTVGDDVQTFEVAPYNNEPPWRWTDPHQSMFRIHCKLLEIEPYT